MNVGLHGRNDVHWSAEDLDVLGAAGIETCKMMSHTEPAVFERIRARYPHMEFIVRLYDDRIGTGHHVTATEFTSKMVPIIHRLRPWAKKFEIHNEPNHASGLEGWGSSDTHAQSFRAWYELVLAQLRDAAGWASYGFPGLAVAQRDMEWLEICRPAINKSDWLGCHCYWQFDNVNDPTWGKRYVQYHGKFPQLPMEVTEFGDSTPNLDEHTMANRIVEWYQEAMHMPYIRSGSAFLLSSPDPQWDLFSWRRKDGQNKEVVHRVGEMSKEEPVPEIDNIAMALPRRPQNAPGGKIKQRKLERVEMLVIHHTVTPRIFPPENIARYHVYNRKYPAIAYHYVVEGDGTIYQTNPLTDVSWHTSGFNTMSIGIALTGTFMNGREPTEKQCRSTSALVCYLQDLLGRDVPVRGHKQLVQTACPGSTWANWSHKVLCE